MILNFVKMHGQGNDYLFFDLRGKLFPLLNLEKFARKISDRHFGVGSDGIVLILDDAKNDAFMRIFNADGSEAMMCGTALRCTTQLLHDNYPDKKEFSITTLSGTKFGEILENGEVKVNLGKATYIKEENFENRKFYLVDIGNPHAISFTDNLQPETAKNFGASAETHFSANIEFAEIVSKNEVTLQIWERGSGITLACGTGSAATVCAGITLGLLSNRVKLNLPGGNVTVERIGNDYFLIGSVTKVFSGGWEI